MVQRFVARHVRGIEPLAQHNELVALVWGGECFGVFPPVASHGAVSIANPPYQVQHLSSLLPSGQGDP